MQKVTGIMFLTTWLCSSRAPIAVLATTVALLCATTDGTEPDEFKITPQATEFFEKHVRPLLAERCFDCHGPETDEGEGRLRLDSLAGISRGGESGPVLVPGKPSQSLLILAVNHDSAVVAMPPDEKLSVEEVRTLTRWIKMGAPWPNAGGNDVSPNRQSGPTAQMVEQGRLFWAFQPPTSPMLPTVDNKSWPRASIDRFVLNQLESHGLHPAPHADRRTLIRRATFDLHGLPATPDQVEAFLADSSPTAFARLIDRLLDSPRYGEHWGRHWLDVARYADSNGMDDNIAHADAWRYRDYVIAAFNSDKPYDEFVREQIAGDLIVHRNDRHRQDAIIATGFLMVGPKMPSADDPVKQQLDIVDEQLDTTCRAFLALTMGCARCHDHKFDPLFISDYYALAGIFKSTRTMVSYRVDSKYNLVALDGSAENRRLTKWEDQLDRHDDALVNGNSLAMTAEEKKSHQDGKVQALQAMESLATAMAVEEGQIQDMHILMRGNHLTPGSLSPRRLPLVLSIPGQKGIAKVQSGRRELAHWIASPDHPLTARVMVNRIWHWHFGQGIVGSVDNFGKLGERPDNQPLLDWLAIQFVESGWSIKAMHRMIMNSSTWQMSSIRSKENSAMDVDNRWRSRYSRRRMTAEMLRDTLLAVSGRLDFTMGGSLLPAHSHKIMSQSEIAEANATFATPRRTIYLPVIRSGLHDLLQTFDFPDPATSTGRRETTTVAPQALLLMNSELVKQSCQHLARRLLAKDAADVSKRIEEAYELLLTRPLNREEANQWQRFLGDYEQAEKRRNVSRQDARASAWEAMFRVLVSSNDFIFID